MRIFTFGFYGIAVAKLFIGVLSNVVRFSRVAHLLVVNFGSALSLLRRWKNQTLTIGNFGLVAIVLRYRHNSPQRVSAITLHQSVGAISALDSRRDSPHKQTEFSSSNL